MRASPIAIYLLVAVSGLAGCQRDVDKTPVARVATTSPQPAAAPPTAPTIVAPTGFHHEAGFDGTGYYMPATTIRVANFQLSNITLGSGSDFAEWENGRRLGEFGPVMLEFNDMSSPMRTTEVGQGHTVNVRVLPTAYSVDSRTISFAGTAPGVGPVVLHAFLDAAVLRRAIGGDVIQTPVAHGTLLIGERRFENVAFTYFAGD